MSAAASTSVSDASTTVTRSASRLRSAGVRAPVGVSTVARQSGSAGSRRSARRNSRSAWRSSWSTKAMWIGPSPRAGAPAGGGSAPGRTTQ